MFKILLILFSLLFAIKAQNLNIPNDNRLKSFTAICADSSSCTYSLVLSSTNQSYEVGFGIYVDSTEIIEQEHVITKTNPVTVNFDVNQGSQIAIQFAANITGNSVQFEVYNQADGKGQLVIDSNRLSFLVLNTCAVGSSCSLIFTRGFGWTPNISAQLKINGTIIAKVNETTPSHNDISYKAFDIMSIEIVGKPEDIIDGLRVAAYKGFEDYLVWYSNSYFTPMIFPAICAPPIPSPFGGPLIPVNQKQIDIFLASVGTSPSTLWYRETEN